MNTTKFNSKYFQYYLQYFRPKWEIFADSARKDPNINQDAVKNLFLCFPKLSDQKNISYYLDAKTSKIDFELSVLEQKIEKYKELKQALITQTVLRGIDSKVKLKSSEVDWLGDIPIHWEIRRGKDIFLEGKKSPFGAAIGEKKGEYPFYTSSQEQTKWINEAIYSKESLIFGTGGSANIHYCKSSFSTSSDCYILHSKYQLNRYYYYFYRSIIREIGIIGFKGSGLEHLQKDFIKLGIVVKPPFEEQVAIVNYLDEKISKIDSIVDSIGKKIEVLKEFRKTLISDVVTGKVKVA